MVEERFEAEGIDVLRGPQGQAVAIENGEKILVVEHDGKEKRIPFDEMLCAVGRARQHQGYGLEELGIPSPGRRPSRSTSTCRRLPEHLRVRRRRRPLPVHAHGFAHGVVRAVNALFGRFKKFKVDYSVVPWATFTDPEVARVGLNEPEAKEKKIPYDVSTYGIDDLDRAIADGEAHGFVKVLTVPGTDKILGVTIVGEHAGEI